MQALLKAVQVLGLRQIFQSQKLRQLSDQTVRGYYTTRAIIALLNVGFFDELRKQGVINPQTFAQTHNLDLTVLQPLCDYLYQQHILGRDGDFYRFEATGRLMIEELEGAYYVVYAYEDVFYNLEPMLRREKQYGTDVRRRSHYVAKGSGGVGKLLAFPMVAELVQRLGYKCILDLGCGDATFLIDLCQRVPGLRAYGLDIAPEAVAEANVNIQRHGLQDRITPVVGDVTNITPELREQLRDVDAATSVYVIHEFAGVSKELIVAALRGFRTAFPGKTLILCEVMRHSPDEIHAKPGGIMEIQLFHELSRQRLVSRPEWHAYFHEAGFTNIREEYLSFARTMLFMVS